MANQETSYELMPSGIDEVELRIVKGTTPSLPPAVVKIVYQLASQYARVKKIADDGAKAQKKTKEEFIPYLDSFPGFRGVRSTPENFNLLAVEKEKVTWNRALLKESLGTVYSALVSEELKASITIPPGAISEEELRQGLVNLLRSLKVPAEDVTKILETEVQLSIDLEKLEELVASGRVSLLPGTKTVEPEWAISVDEVRQPQKQKVETKKPKLKTETKATAKV